MDKYDEGARALYDELNEEEQSAESRCEAIAAFARRCAEEAREVERERWKEKMRRVRELAARLPTTLGVLMREEIEKADASAAKEGK